MLVRDGKTDRRAPWRLGSFAAEHETAEGRAGDQFELVPSFGVCLGMATARQHWHLSLWLQDKVTALPLAQPRSQQQIFVSLLEVSK